MKGRGLDFVWARKYRSRPGPNSVQGNDWDFSYNIYVEPSGPDLILHDGNSRTDLYRNRGNSTWTRREFSPARARPGLHADLRRHRQVDLPSTRRQQGSRQDRPDRELLPVPRNEARQVG